MRNELLVIEDAAVDFSIPRKISAQVGFNTTRVGPVDRASMVPRMRHLDGVTPDLSLSEGSGIVVLDRVAELKFRGPVLSASDPIDLIRLRQTLKQMAHETGRQGMVRAAAGSGQ